MRSASRLLVLVLTCCALAASAYAQSPREQLNQMVQQLQKTPADDALREKLIKLALTLKPAPAMPEEARRAFIRGNAAMSEAKTTEEYARAVQLYEEALTIAPWWGDPYFNLGKARELRQEYDRAIQALRFFVLATPSGDEARKAQDYSYVLEEKRDRQAKAEGTRKREEAQKLQRQAWAQDLARWMTENYGRSPLRRVTRFWGTDERSRTSNWEFVWTISRTGDLVSKDWSHLNKTLSFRPAGPAGDEIVFSGVAHNGIMTNDFCGTVNGPRPDDVNWAQCGVNRPRLAAAARFVKLQNGKPIARLKYDCQPNGECHHVDFEFEFH